MGMYFHKKVWKSYQMYKSRVLLSVAQQIIQPIFDFFLTNRVLLSVAQQIIQPIFDLFLTNRVVVGLINIHGENVDTK